MCDTVISITNATRLPPSMTSSLVDDGTTGPICAEPFTSRIPCLTVSNGSVGRTFPTPTPSDTISGCTMSEPIGSTVPPDWEQVLSSAARLQRILPEAVLVGGTAAALHAGHRASRDADHVLTDLRSHFDDILDQLEAVAGWKTARVNRPVLIPGSLDGIETGVRQLIRTQPLETTTVSVGGQEITIPTGAEILRIKGFLLLRRNATRDYVDFAALAHRLGEVSTAAAFERFDPLYPQSSGGSALQQMLAQLALPAALRSGRHAPVRIQPPSVSLARLGGNSRRLYPGRDGNLRSSVWARRSAGSGGGRRPIRGLRRSAPRCGQLAERLRRRSLLRDIAPATNA